MEAFISNRKVVDGFLVYSFYIITQNQTSLDLSIPSRSTHRASSIDPALTELAQASLCEAGPKDVLTTPGMYSQEQY